MPREVWKRTHLTVVAAAGVLLLGAHLLPAPKNGNLAGLPTICPFKALTAIPCPGCGLTRSLVFSAHGDWAQAFHFHPLGPVFYGALWLALAAGVLTLRFQPRPATQRWAFALAGAYAASLGIVWLIRLTGVLPYPPNF